MNRYIELLAPAKNLTCGIEAIRHGADAVYIGAEHFGARAAAGNSVADIRTLCAYAHQFHARVYVTVNTILYDAELDATRCLVWQLYEAGVDALIVQDLALLKMDLPPIPLHASTQMDNRTPQKALWLMRQGYEQVVLARELSLEQTAAIHAALQAESARTGRPAPQLEAFVHGALCVSYSGQCYASQHCFGRSANRGECAQFCRLAFDLVDARGQAIAHDRHLLSLRDMNRAEHLEQMIDAGVSSFKIEGRLKDVSYVKNITAYYRQRLDAIIGRRPDLRRTSIGTAAYTFTPDAAKSFNRGFTDYFLHGRTNTPIWNFATPKAMGQPLGHVKEVRGGTITVATTAALHNGDGFCYIDPAGRLQGFRANRAEGNRILATSAGQEPAGKPSLALPGLLKGTLLYRNMDADFERLLARPSAQRHIGVRWLLTDSSDTATEGFTLSLTAEDGTSASRFFAHPHEEARSPQADNIRKQLSRLGDTIFQALDVSLQLSHNWFLPSSVLADWRRQLTDSLLQRLLDTHQRRATNRLAGAISPSPEFSGQALSFAANAANHLALEAYAEAGATAVQPAYELEAVPQAVVMTCRHCIRFAMGLCPKHGVQGQTPQKPHLSHTSHPAQASHPLPWSLRLPDGRQFALHFDCQRCEMTVSAS